MKKIVVLLLITFTIALSQDNTSEIGTVLMTLKKDMNKCIEITDCIENAVYELNEEKYIDSKRCKAFIKQVEKTAERYGDLLTLSVVDSSAIEKVIRRYKIVSLYENGFEYWYFTLFRNKDEWIVIDIDASQYDGEEKRNNDIIESLEKITAYQYWMENRIVDVERAYDSVLAVLDTTTQKLDQILRTLENSKSTKE